MVDTRQSAEPEDVGISQVRLEALYDRVRVDVDQEKVPSAQVAVARHGKLVGFRTFGRAVHSGFWRPATNESLYTIYSVSKPLVAVLIWRLIDEGKLQLDQRIAEIIPEFAENGKEAVTIEHVLSHSGGFPAAPLHPDKWGNREMLLEALRKWRLTYEPGTRFEAHVTSGHWLLSEIIYRITETDYRDYFRTLVKSMGLTDMFLGLPPELNHRVVDGCYVRDTSGAAEVTSENMLRFNQPRVREIGVPSAGIITDASQLAMFYQTLINRGFAPSGQRVLSAHTIDIATRPRTGDFVDQNGSRATMALGVKVANGVGDRTRRGFGKRVSARAFGWPTGAWGDPETGLSVGWCSNALGADDPPGKRASEIADLAVETLL